MPRLARNGASGWFSTNFTVRSSTFSIALDEVREAHAVEIFPGRAGDILVPGIVGLQLPLEGEDHVVGVQVARRREEVGGLEFHARAQLEGVFQAVVGDFPAFRQARRDRWWCRARTRRGGCRRCATTASKVVPAV